MADPTFAVEVDTGGDGSFATDVIQDVLDISWNVGFTRPWQLIPPPARLRFTLDNGVSSLGGKFGYYNPEHGNVLSGFEVGRAVRVQSTLSGTTRNETLMWIKTIKPSPGADRADTVQVECEGWLARARSHVTDPALQMSKTADELLEALLDASVLYPPGFTGYWLAGVPGHSEAGESTRAGAASVYSDFDTGTKTFDYAFDNVRDGTTLYSLLRYVVESEQGRVFVDRDGKVIFWNSVHLAEIYTSAETFANVFSNVNLRYGSQIKNIVVGTYNPRELDTSGTPTLATLDKAVSVPAGKVVEVAMPYRDGTTNKITTTDPIDPVATTDWTANSESDGSGTNLTSSFSVIATHYARKSTWSVTNSGSVDGYLEAGATQRGNNKLTDYGRKTMSVQDDDSIADYGRLTLRLNAALFGEPSDIDNLIRGQLALRKDPQPDLEYLSFQPRISDTMINAALEHSVGTRITAQDTESGLDEDFFIVGVHHHLRAPRKWNVRWVVEPAEAQVYWLAGVTGRSEAGQTTIAGFS